MVKYRYRTATLVGPWRQSAWEAECDAVAANLAEFDDPKLVSIRWRVPGEIEEEAGGAGARSAR